MTTSEFPSAMRVHTRLIEKKKRVRSKPATSKKAATNVMPESAAKKTSGETVYWWDDWPELVLSFSLVRQPGILSQVLKYGIYQVHFFGELISEAVFVPAYLSGSELETVKKEAEQHGLSLVSLEHFVGILILVGYRFNGLITGFDLSYDLSYIASGHDHPSRGFFKGGFILRFKEYDIEGITKPDLFTPRVAIKHVGAKGVIIAWRKPAYRSRMREAISRGYGRGEFLDLQTFVYALTDDHCTFVEACKLFSVDPPDHEALSEFDGCYEITCKSFELYRALISEYKNHPVPTPPNHLYSPASLGKSYFSAMGISSPELLISPELNLSPDQIHGLSFSAIHAGRCELNLRLVETPVVSLDYKSMYPTVNILMGLWDMITAKYVKVEDATADVTEFINRIEPDDILNKNTWREINVIALVELDGDFLPGRFQLSQRQNYYSLSWGYLNSGEDDGTKMRWYGLPDLIASKFVIGKAPRILKALRFTASGKQESLHPTNIRMLADFNPYSGNFFKVLVEERQRAKDNAEVNKNNWAEQSLKLIANVTGYGIYSELNPDPDKAEAMVTVYSDRVFKSKATYYERPGKFYFPIISTLVTSGAHLMLALLQYKVEKSGGRCVYKDTDSMMIAASSVMNNLEFEDHNGQSMTVPIIGIKEVDKILGEFDQLNPYNKNIIHGILRKEKENFKPEGRLPAYNVSTGEFIELTNTQVDGDLLFYAIATKRYCLYNRTDKYIILRKGSESSLGQWISPIDGDDDGQWIKQFWMMTVNGGIPDEEDSRNIYAGKPLVSQFPVSTSGIMRSMQALNDALKLPYYAGIKPFDLLMHPIRDDLSMADEPENVFLVAPLRKNLTEALAMKYIDLNTPGGVYKISVHGMSLSSIDYDTGELVEYIEARDQNDYLGYYSAMPDNTMVDCHGQACSRKTVGELFPREFNIKRNDYIGKEFSMSEWEEVDPWEFADNSYNLYTPDDWDEIMERLKEIPVYKIAEASRIDAGNITLYLSGRRRPNESNIMRLRTALFPSDGRDEWEDRILPWLSRTSTARVSILSGMPSRTVRYLKTRGHKPSPETLEKLRIAMSMYERSNKK